MTEKTLPPLPKSNDIFGMREYLRKHNGFDFGKINQTTEREMRLVFLKNHDKECRVVPTCDLCREYEELMGWWDG